jgi:outer membrane immunogenic protein
MKRISFLSGALIASALLAALSGNARAADLPLKTPVAPVPWTCTWCGFYVGFNVGGATTSDNGINNAGTDTGAAGLGTALALGGIPYTATDRVAGFVGGGQIGYNWQFWRTMFLGLEADFDALNAKGSFVAGPYTSPISAGTTTVNYSRQADWISTIRARWGFTAMNHDALLVYGTGGIAIARWGLTSQFVCPACAPNPATEASTFSSNDLTRVGLAIGAGFEWMFIPKVTFKAEYLYAEVGSQNTTIRYAYPAANQSSLYSSTRDGMNMVRAGLNFLF